MITITQVVMHTVLLVYGVFQELKHTPINIKVLGVKHKIQNTMEELHTLLAVSLERQIVLSLVDLKYQLEEDLEAGIVTYSQYESIKRIIEGDLAQLGPAIPM
jgi:hypothetical protein